MMLLGTLMLGCTFVFACSVALLVGEAQNGTSDATIPAALVAIATGIASAVGLVGATFFLAGPWLAVEKIRRTHAAQP